MNRRRPMHASRAVARAAAQATSAGRARGRPTTRDADWIDSSLVSIDGLPPALAWLLGVATGLATVALLGWFRAPVAVAVALPWLAVYLVRSAGVRPTGTARSPRSAPIALVSCVAIVAGMGIVGNVLSGFMSEDPAEQTPPYHDAGPWVRMQEPGGSPEVDIPPAPASTSTGEPDASTTDEPDATTTDEPATTTGELDAVSATTGQVPDDPYEPLPTSRPRIPKKTALPKLCAAFKNRVTFDEDGTMSKRSVRAIDEVANRMKKLPTLKVRIVVRKKGVISTKPVQDYGEEVRDRILERTEVEPRRLSIDHRRGDGDWVEFEPANEECRDAR